LAAEQTTALVLRTIEFSETSLVVTLLTKDYGRVSALAKGARRPKGPFEGSLDLLSVCRVVVIRKNSEALDLLTEAKLLRRFRGAERSLQRVYAGYYVAEMLRLLLTDDHDPHPDIYDLALQTLDQIDGSGQVASALAWFDAQALRMLGQAPATTQCTECGRRLPRTPRVVFALLGGGVVCGDCRARQQQTVSVRQEVIDELGRLTSPQTRLPTEVAPQLYGELRAVMNRYIQTMLGTMPRMQSYLPTVIRTESST
jgi:DNA repair protein RecO (recombination protein O)